MDPQFAKIVRGELTDGRHRNSTGRPEYFMATFFHHPDELRTEVAEASFADVSVSGVDGPGWLLTDFDDWWKKTTAAVACFRSPARWNLSRAFWS